MIGLGFGGPYSRVVGIVLVGVVRWFHLIWIRNDLIEMTFLKIVFFDFFTHFQYLTRYSLLEVKLIYNVLRVHFLIIDIEWSFRKSSDK